VDSVPIREWQECLDKGAALIVAAGSELDPDLRPTPNRLELRGGGVFETILVVGGHPYRLADHLARLDRSCRELYGSGLSTDLPSRIALLLSDAAPPPTTRQTLRVRALPAGQTVHLDLTLSARGDRLRDCEMRLAERPSVSWRHKWVDRGALLAAEAAVAPALPYFGSPGVTETSRGNLFLRTDRGVWLTPPLDDDVLPGVTRRAVLDLMEETGVGYHIAAVSVEQFRDASAAFWTSSLSGAVPITAVDGEALPCDDPTGLASLVNDALGFSQ
jgi:para-aminobenzoate synthetase/4-amino-4-deoxychorismate lyase